jgi:hypothetical protein
MKKFFVFCMVVAFALLISQQSFAAKICLTDNFGNFYQIKGGKIDKKSYTVKIDAPGLCVVTGHAETSLNGTGQTVVGMLTSHDVTGNCLTVRWTWIAANPDLLSGTGNFDQNGDGTNDGAVTFTNLSCSSLPPFGPSPQVDPNNPLKKQAKPEEK